jgi:hypothetical protein
MRGAVLILVTHLHGAVRNEANRSFAFTLYSEVWSVALYGAETWTLRAVDQKHLESFEMWCWRRM